MNILNVNFVLRDSPGGILQCYALQELLKSMGHNVIKVDEIQQHKFHFSLIQLLIVCKRILYKYILRRPTKDVLHEYYCDQNEFYPRKNAEAFIAKYLNIVRVNSLSDLSSSTVDAIIVGSDQVWRKAYSDHLLTDKYSSDNAFLSFAYDWHCKKIAYAASFGVDYWEYSVIETDILRSLLSKFDAVSVREDSAIDLIHNYLDDNIQIEHVLDPTMLIDKRKYISIFENAHVPASSGEMLTYILDDCAKKKEIIEGISGCFKYRIFRVNNPNIKNLKLSLKQRLQTPIEVWLRGFYDAKIVVTDSFHACVFSIIFNKPFWVIENRDRGMARIESLMRLFGLEDRIIYDSDKKVDYTMEVNWEKVNLQLEKYKIKSINFLRQSLK